MPMTPRQNHLYVELSTFVRNLWPIFQAKGFTSIDLAYNSYCMAQLTSGFNATTFSAVAGTAPLNTQTTT